MGVTSTFVYEGEEVHVPAWVADLSSFRRWAESDQFPERGRICFLKGRVWVDMSKEQIFSHLLVKGEFTRVLGNLVKSEQLGLFLPDGLLLSNPAADISVRPDGTSLSSASLRIGSVRLVEGVDEGYVEVEGSPDMVLEIVSRSSVHKDTVFLHGAYWEAGVQEYWLVDARKTPLRFDIYRRSPRGFAAVRKQGGWLKSGVFGKAVRLTVQSHPAGHPEYTLEVR